MLTDFDTHFRILGLRSNASYAEVKEARRWYTKAFHPDRFPAGSPDAAKAAQKQKEINLAFDELKKWFDGGQTIKPSPQQKGGVQPARWQSRKRTNWPAELLDYLDGLPNSGKSSATVENIRSDLHSFELWLLETYADVWELPEPRMEAAVVKYASTLAKLGYSPSTIARHLYSIRGFFDYANIDARFIPPLAYEYKAELRPQAKYLNPKQLASFSKVLSRDAFEEDEALITFILNTGVSVSELCALRWKDLTFERVSNPRRRCLTMCVTGRAGKRNVPLNYIAVGALTALGLENITQKNSKLLDRKIFLRGANDMTPKIVHYIIDRYAKTARMNVTPSILRNTFCRKLADSGVPRQHLAQLIGISEQSAKVYYHDPAPDMDELVAAVDNA